MSGGRATIKSLEEGRAWVHANRQLWDRPGLVLLNGPMGAGKTQLVQWMLAELGGDEPASPTFAIHHRYEASARTVDHFDLYRLQSDEELESSGFWEIVAQTDNLVFVEWADRLPADAYPSTRSVLSIEIKTDPSGSRLYSW